MVTGTVIVQEALGATPPVASATVVRPKFVLTVTLPVQRVLLKVPLQLVEGDE